jgi:prepilin peptidase CpaA
MGEWPIIALLTALACLLVSAGLQDVASREIANWKNAAIALLAPLWWWSTGYALWPEVAAQVAFAGIVLAIFAFAFARGWMGGGDVKMIAALALWFPLLPMIWLLTVMSLVGGAITLAMVIERAVKRSEEPPEVPYGVAIAIAALLSLREPILNQFT